MDKIVHVLEGFRKSSPFPFSSGEVLEGFHMLNVFPLASFPQFFTSDSGSPTLLLKTFSTINN